MDGGVPLPFATVARTHRDDEFGEWSMHVRAVAITKPGNPDGMEVIDAPDPSPGPDEVVVATEAIGVGGVDVVVRRGEIATPPDGWIPGGEVVGRVVSIGTAVDPAWLGMRVWSYTGITAQHPDAGALLPDGLSSIDGGGYAELAVAPANELTVVPDELSSVDAAALGSPLPVGHFALAHARFRRGDSLLVRGAAGSIGIATVELAARAGASSIAVTTSSDGRGTRLRELGATHVLDRAGRGDTSAPESYDVIVDIAGGSAVPAFVDRLAPNGRYVVAGIVAGMPPLDFGRSLITALQQSRSVATFSLDTVPVEDRGRVRAELFDAAARDELHAVVHDVIGLDRAAEAHRRMETGEVFGRIVLTL